MESEINFFRPLPSIPDTYDYDFQMRIFRLLCNCSANEPESFLSHSFRGYFSTLKKVLNENEIGIEINIDALLTLTDEQLAELADDDEWTSSDFWDMCEKYDGTQLRRLGICRKYYMNECCLNQIRTDDQLKAMIDLYENPCYDMTDDFVELMEDTEYHFSPNVLKLFVEKFRRWLNVEYIYEFLKMD